MKLVGPSLLLAISVALIACDADSGHPTAEQTLQNYRPAEAVGTVDGRAVGAEEARIVAGRTGAGPKEVAQYLADRELLVSAALRDGKDASFARKRAMVRALLADEIESKVGPEDVDEEQAEQDFPAARRALLGPCGSSASIMTVAHEPVDEPARDRVFDALVAGYAESSREFLSSSEQPAEALQTAEASVSWPLRVTRDPNARVSDTRCPIDRSDSEWMHDRRMVRTMMQIREDLLVRVPAGERQYLAVKTGTIRPEPPTEEEVNAEVMRRQVAATRNVKLQVLLERLKDSGTFEIFPSAIEEQQVTE